jgi:hypothetical protein
MGSWLLASPDTFDGDLFGKRYTLNPIKDFWLEPKGSAVYLFLRDGITLPDDPPILDPGVMPVYRRILYGNGSPEGVVVGSPGDAYFNGLGGAFQTFWVKESGIGTSDGWIFK